MKRRLPKRSAILLIVPFVAFGIFSFGKEETKLSYDRPNDEASVVTSSSASSSAPLPVMPTAPERVVTHLRAPEPLYGAYMTSCIASGKRLRAPLVSLIERSILNAVVIDIKDFSGMVSIDTGDPRFVLNTNGCTIPDIEDLIDELHEKGIYVIGRVTVMQDSTFTKHHPEAAVKRRSDGTTWRDKKGLSFIDPGATEYWQYMIDLGKASYALGFDEINYDYIRYPSDGDMSDALYARSASTTKAEMMKRFYRFLGDGMRDEGIPTSADLFGMTTTNEDDLGIGQVLENALVSFDYVAPMVYPSHFPPTFNGWPDPNLVPYELIRFTMSRAVERANALEKRESGFAPSTSTPHFAPTGKYAKRLRPWLEDFDCCAPNSHHYTEEDVRAQMKGTYDAGLTSWMMWDPRNEYTDEAFIATTTQPTTTGPMR